VVSLIAKEMNADCLLVASVTETRHGDIFRGRLLNEPLLLLPSFSSKTQQAAATGPNSFLTLLFVLQQFLHSASQQELQYSMVSNAMALP
jgi:hypothetical protein